MNRTIKFAAALGLSLLAASPAMAQQRKGQGGGMGMMGGRGGMGLAMLAANPSVQEELKLDAAQKEKAAELSEKAREKMMSSREALQDLEPAERMAKMREMTEKADAETIKGLTGVFSAEQIARLEGISIQAAGPAAFESPSLQAKLKVTADQKKEIASLVSASTQEMRDLFQNAGDDRQAAMAKMADLRKSTVSKIEATMTSEQKAEYAKIVGAPFEIRMQGGPGGPGGGQGGRRRPNN